MTTNYFSFQMARSEVPAALLPLLKMVKFRSAKIQVTVSASKYTSVSSGWAAPQTVSLGKLLKNEDGSYVGSDGEYNDVAILTYTGPVIRGYAKCGSAPSRTYIDIAVGNDAMGEAIVEALRAAAIDPFSSRRTTDLTKFAVALDRAMELVEV